MQLKANKNGKHYELAINPRSTNLNRKRTKLRASNSSVYFAEMNSKFFRNDNMNAVVPLRTRTTLDDKKAIYYYLQNILGE